MRKLASALLLLLLIPALPCMAGEENQNIVLYVGYQTMDGFADPGLIDSANDLQKALKKRKFRFTDSMDQAHVVLIVVRRVTGSEIIGSQTSVNRGIFGGLFARNVPIREGYKYVFVTVAAGQYKDEWWGYHSTIWKKCAGAIAKLFDRWVETNKALILGK